MNYRRFKKVALGKLCRDCINESYDIQLSRKDCLYWMYPAACKCCGEVKNIVTGIDPLSRWKIWLLIKRKN